MTLRDRSNNHRVFLAYGALPWDGGMFFILRAEVQGHQWQRDFVPAVNRYAARATGKPAVSRDRFRGRVERLISGIEGFALEEEAGYVERALTGQTSHHWTWYNPETREIEPLEIEEEARR